MLQLVEFLSRNRNFIFFVLLQILCFWLVASTHSRWNATYFNSSNYYVARSLAFSNALQEYTNLRSVNEDLAAENVRLNQLVTALQQQKGLADMTEAVYQPDSVFAARFEYRVAKVIDNSTQLANNYLTIDKGTAHGIKPGMGVISATGIVGKVRYCSEHFSVITSILHTQFLVSSRLIRSNEMGTAKWDGVDPEIINLNDVSRYKKVLKGDTAVTSDYNAVFPPNVKVGMVEGVKIRPDQTFYDIRLRLATDFRNLRYVYVVSNRLIEEQEALQKRVEEAP